MTLMTEARTRSWFGEPPPIHLPPAQIAGVVRHEMRGLPCNGYPVALQPFVVPQASYRELLAATTKLIDLLHRAVLSLAPDRAGRMVALGIDPLDCPMFIDDEAFELRHCADMARPDVVVGPDGPKFVEFNVSAGFGGMVQFQMYHRAWRRLREMAGRRAYLGVDPFARLATLLERTCAELDVPPAVVLVGTTREYGPGSYDRHFDVQIDMLRGHGVHAVHLDFEDLVEGIGLPGAVRWPLGLAEFTIQDGWELGYDTQPARAALDAGFRMIPSQSSWFLHTKKLLALLSEGLDFMTAADRDLAARYLPWSRVVGDRAVTWRGAVYDLPRLLVERRESFILKGATGMAGHEVTFGSRVGADEWATAVALAVATGYYIAQEVVEPVLYPVHLVTESGDVYRAEANSVLSPFCIGGVGAGCYVRFVESAVPGVISALGDARLSCLLAEA